MSNDPHQHNQKREASTSSDACCGNGCGGEDDPDAEARHFADIVAAFRYYHKHANLAVKRRVETFLRLAKEHKALLAPDYPEHLHALKDAIAVNAALIPEILRDVGGMFENVEHSEGGGGDAIHAASDFQMEKLQSTLRQIVRDWSSEGAVEREASYGPVIKALEEEFPQPQGIRIAVPGSGLARWAQCQLRLVQVQLLTWVLRLPWELARRGFSAQGNEFSLFMLFVSNFILNRSTEAECFGVQPFVHQSTNNVSYEDVLREVRFPDVDPRELPEVGSGGSGLSMAAGDFCEVYGEAAEAGAWDAVASVFFLDTAHNPISYVETIHRMLRPGGVWVNFGPLLYHFADSAGEESIELPWAQLRQVIAKLGFSIEKEELNIPAHYTSNSRSMLQHGYKCAFMVARKLPAV